MTAPASTTTPAQAGANETHSHDHPAGHGHATERGHEHGHGHGHRHDHGSGHDHDHGHSSGMRGFVLGLVKPHSHDSADSVDPALEASAEGIRALKVSLVGAPLTALAQAVVVWFTGSVALFADTVHNFSDALTAVPRGSRSSSVGERPPGATPTATTAPRISPASSSSP